MIAPVNLRAARALVLVALSALLCSAGGRALAAEPDLITAQALLREGKAAEAYALLEPFEVDKAGDPLFDYLLATAALQSGRPSKATFIYERILAVSPNYAGVRADMARAYYELGDYARAKLEFEMVLKLEKLPADLRSAVEQYVAAIDRLRTDRKTVARGYLQGGYGRDTNISSAGAGGVITGPNGEIIGVGAAGLKRPDNYWAVQLGGELTHQAADNLNLFAAADYQGRAYSDFADADYALLDGRLGASYAGGRYQITGTLFLGRYWTDDRPIRDNLGVGLDWRYALDTGNQLTANLFVTRYDFSGPFAVNDIDFASLTLGWNRALTPSTAVGAFVSAGGEHATNNRPDGDKRFLGVRLTFQTALSQNLGAFGAAGVQSGDYDQINPGFGIERRDWLYDAALGVSWTFAERWSLQPQFSWTRNDSNLAPFDFDRIDLSVQVRRDFY